MKTPRDPSGEELIRRLGRLGYVRQRQRGSHVRLVCKEQGVHRISVPLHDDINVGTLSGILSAVARHHKLTQEKVLRRLLG